MSKTLGSMAGTAANSDYAKLQSEVIDFLRFPMIVQVLFVHNTFFNNLPKSDRLPLPLYTLSKDFFSHTLGHLAVPTFFFISGFLFYLNCDKFDINTWLKKLKSRMRTLLVPYLFWNILALVALYIAWHIPTLSSFFNKSFVSKFTWQYFLEALWALPDTKPEVIKYPVAYQFWFIRDLMVMVLLSPIVYYFVKKGRIIGIVLLGLLWFSEWWHTWIPWLAGYGLSADALFFFSAGAWFAINKRNIVEDTDGIANVVFILYPSLALADVFTKLHAAGVDHVYLPFVHNLGILVGVTAGFALAAHLLRTGKVRIIPFLSSASFFIFAAHEPLFLSALRKVIFVIFQPQSDMALTTIYFLIVIVVVVVLLGVYWLLRRLLPGFTRGITAGR